MKQKNMKRVMLIFMILISMLLTPITTAVDNPTITVDPAQPKPQGTVTFTVTIPTAETITNAVIYVEECESGLCFTDNFNETMTKTGSDTYEATITLRHKTAVEMKYQVGYATSSGWTWYPADTGNSISVDLDTSGNNDGGDSGGSDTPGFEAIAFIAAVSFILFMFFKRRR
ncbi:MAG: hypothetical protein R6U21_05155 [Thermoplasmatota archaeon]